MSAFSWSAKSEEAVELIVDDRLSNRKIAERIGVAQRTIERWKTNKEFSARVALHLEETRAAAMTHGIADRINRIRRLDRHWRLMQTLIEERAEQTNTDVPGASTGLIVRKEKETKYGIEVDHAFDAALLAELRATEMQAAKELGQWVEKQSVDGAVDHRHAFADLKDLSDEELQREHQETLGDTA